MAAEHRIAKSLRAATTFRRRRSEFTPYLHHEQVEPWFDTRIPIKPGELATENLSSARLILLAHGYSLRGVRQPQLWFIDAAYGFGLFRQQPCAARTNLECIHILKGTEDFSDGKSADCRAWGYWPDMPMKAMLLNWCLFACCGHLFILQELFFQSLSYF